MSESESLFTALRQAADAEVVGAIERLVHEAPDRALSRINALDFARAEKLDEEPVIAGFLHAARTGLFDLSWNILCPSCAGVLDANSTLKTVTRPEYRCAFCAAGYEPVLDEVVEVTFTVSPRLRRIAAHDPEMLSLRDYYRQIFWSSGIDLPDDEALAKVMEGVMLEAIELPAGEKAILSLTLPLGLIIVFDPVTHSAQFIEVKGEPTRERQSLSLLLDNRRVPTATTTLRPGPLRLTLENRSATRALPGVWIADHELERLLSRRKPYLTAKRLLTNQTFRDIYRADTLDVEQRLKITSLTFLFTDLKGSTELYDRVGDLVAYDLVRRHFRVLTEIVGAEAGAVVKTIGDAVMATFPTPKPCGRGGAPHARGDARPQRGAQARRSSAQDRHPRRTLPRGHAERAPGLFRPDRQHRFAGPESRLLARGLRNGSGRGPRGGGAAARAGRRPAGAPAPGAARRRRRSPGLRDPVIAAEPPRL
jgi:class 3 adenylate cyclase